MKSEEQIPMPEGSLEMIDADDTSSVDDFIRELEAKEKDLHITADLRIEIEDSDSDFVSVPEFVKEELKPAPVLSPVAPVVTATATKARNFELESEIAALKVRVMELKAERHEIQKKSDRRVKDFENFKYRMDRERRGAYIDHIANVAAQMLPVLDNLNRALDSAGRPDDDGGEAFKRFYDGIVLVNQQVNEVFAGMGVQPIATIGELFDPNFHEAVAAEERSDIPPNTISGEMLRGYRIGNRVIRHSMVRVASAPVTEMSPPPSAEPASLPSKSLDYDSTQIDDE
jgi:molecular chaperone GrpE